jgi:phospholipase/carboxylesterase
LLAGPGDAPEQCGHHLQGIQFVKRLETPAAIVLEPDTTARSAVIWLHGLGANGEDFVPIANELGLPRDHSIRFVFPHAPVRPVTLSGGLPMRAWYDIVALTREGRQDAAGVRASEATVRELIRQQNALGVPSSRIVIAGFSQGGAVALHTALRYPEPLGGLLALSTYLPLDEHLQAEAHGAQRDLPILMQHGLHDPTVSYEFGSNSRDALRAAGFTVEWNEYPMQHELCGPQIKAIGAWLRARLG